MKWSILILTQPSRVAYLKRLKDALMPQLEGHPEVEVCERIYQRHLPHDPSTKLNRGKNRFAMYEESTAEYVCFVDDDDLVAEDYVSSILPLLDGVDYIGFQVQLYHGDVGHCFKDKPTYHSLEFPNWHTTNDAYFRDLSHVNPIKRELAMQAKEAMCQGDGNEDVMWADAMRTLGIVKTQHYVPKVMYHYYWRAGHSD